MMFTDTGCSARLLGAVYVDGEFQGGLDIVSYLTFGNTTHTDIAVQVKEEFENDPDFLKQYAVAPKAAAA